MARPSIEAQRHAIASRIERKRAARQSIAADQALLVRLTNQQIRAEVRARRKGAA